MPLLLLLENPNFGVIEIAYEEFSNRLRKVNTGQSIPVAGQPFTVIDTITPFDSRRYAPIPSGGTLIYKALLVDEDGNPQLAEDLSAFTLSIRDTATGTIVNNIDEENLLTGTRLTFDTDGVFRLSVAGAETTLAAPDTKKLRSLILEWRYGSPELIGRHQADFMVVRLAGD